MVVKFFVERFDRSNLSGFSHPWNTLIWNTIELTPTTVKDFNLTGHDHSRGSTLCMEGF